MQASKQAQHQAWTAAAPAPVPPPSCSTPSRWPLSVRRRSSPCLPSTKEAAARSPPLPLPRTQPLLPLLRPPPPPLPRRATRKPKIDRCHLPLPYQKQECQSRALRLLFRCLQKAQEHQRHKAQDNNNDSRQKEETSSQVKPSSSFFRSSSSVSHSQIISH